MGSFQSNMSVLRLPTSPLKVGILQPSNKANLSLKPSQILPDSTDENKQELFKKHHHSVKKMQTPSVSRRNARERNRVKQVNNGFATLRTSIPHLKNKTSKVDTLRAAVDYIKALRNLMGEPLLDDQLIKGPILITEVEEQKMNRNSEMDESFTSDLNDSRPNHSPPRSMSAASDVSLNELPPMVYQLPAPLNPTVEYVEHPMSPSSSTSSGSGSNPRADSSTHIKNYLDDIPVDFQNWDWNSGQQQH